jgi:hypothetical protein
MSDQAREEKIKSYGKAYQTLMDAIEKYPRDMWQFKPSTGDWSIHEIIIHITDSEANSYIRCRRFLAEPGFDLMAYDEMKWAKLLDYHDQSPEDALELFKWLRKKSFDLIGSVPDDVWRRECFHPEDGMITFDDWLDTYERHVPEHISQMERVYEEWNQRAPGAA